jgi:hypothetical protein
VRTAGPVQLPNDQAITGLHRGERLLAARPIIPRPTGLVGTQLARLHLRVKQRIAWQVGRLPVGVTRHPHGAHQHVQKTPLYPLPYTPAIRQGLSHRLCRVLVGVSSPCAAVSAITCFPDTQARLVPTQRAWHSVQAPTHTILSYAGQTRPVPCLMCLRNMPHDTQVLSAYDARLVHASHAHVPAGTCTHDLHEKWRCIAYTYP